MTLFTSRMINNMTGMIKATKNPITATMSPTTNASRVNRQPRTGELL